jgi:predicted nucleic acid-binding protein
LLDEARYPATALYVTSQILCEFYSVITNPRRVAAASTSAQALKIILGLLALPGLHVLAAPAHAVMNLLMELLQRRPITGSAVFDLQIAATMLANNIQRIYTFNDCDFMRFPELEVVRP